MRFEYFLYGAIKIFSFQIRKKTKEKRLDKKFPSTQVLGFNCSQCLHFFFFFPAFFLVLSYIFFIHVLSFFTCQLFLFSFYNKFPSLVFLSFYFFLISFSFFFFFWSFSSFFKFTSLVFFFVLFCTFGAFNFCSSVFFFLICYLFFIFLFYLLRHESIQTIFFISHTFLLSN